jgi:DNA-binding MltR family transcriptional regulator
MHRTDCFESRMGTALTPEQKQTVDTIVKKFGPLFRESDRGCVLLAVARLDETLGMLHKDHIATTTSHSKKVIEELFRPYAPLATFSGRIQIAYGYGLISHADYLDFETTRKIRNGAAHSSEDFTFEKASVRDAVFTLKSTERIYKAIPEMGGLTTEEEKFLKTPNKDKNSVKMYFLTSCIALELSVVSKHLTILGGNLREAIKQNRHLFS